MDNFFSDPPSVFTQTLREASPNRDLVLACLEDDPAKVSAALDAGADPDFYNENCVSAAMFCLSKNRAAAFRELWKHCRRSACDRNGCNALNWAQYGGASPENLFEPAEARILAAQCEKLGRSALTEAIAFGRSAWADWLIQHGAGDPDFVDSRGQCPLHAAIRKGNHAAISLLIPVCDPRLCHGFPDGPEQTLEEDGRKDLADALRARREACEIADLASRAAPGAPGPRI